MDAKDAKKIDVDGAEGVEAYRLKDGRIAFVIDPSKDLGPSSSGKTILVASTKGNKTVDAKTGLKVGLNAFHKKTD